MTAAGSLFLRFFKTLGNKIPSPSASAHCMDAAACRYLIMAATAQISRQLAFLLTTTTWEDSGSIFLM